MPQLPNEPVHEKRSQVPKVRPQGALCMAFLHSYKRREIERPLICSPASPCGVGQEPIGYTVSRPSGLLAPL
jgi:hypothetical protein